MDDPGTRVGLPVSPRDIAVIRSHDDDKGQLAWNNIRKACEKYLRRWRFPALENYVDDIVDEAIVENIDALLSLDIPPGEAVVMLARSLSKHRARLRRYAERFATDEGIPEIIDDQRTDEVIYTEYTRDVFQVVKRAIDAGLLSLSDKDYSLLLSRYGLPDVGGRYADRSIYDYKSNASKTGLYRARQRLLRAIEAFLSDAAAGGTKRSKDVLETALKVLRAGDFQYLYSLTSDERPRSRTKRREDTRVASSVSPPAFAIIWDPEAVTEADYLELTSALGDLVRSEGGLGIELIDSHGLGVEVPVEVLV